MSAKIKPFEKKILIVYAVLFLLSIVHTLVWLKTSTVDDIQYIYADISECERLETYSPNAVVTRYDSPEKDPYFNASGYNKFYAASYESDEVDFEIFAYEFSTQNEARCYSFQVEDPSIVEDEEYQELIALWPDADFGYAFKQWVVYYEAMIYVLDGNNAYCAITYQPFREDEMVEVLKNCFSKEVVKEETN